MKTFLSLVSVLATLTMANSQTYTSTMNGTQDGGGARQGSGSVTLSLSGTALTLVGTFSGLSSSATAGHIHGPGAPGLNVGVIYDLLGGGVIQSSGTFGTYNGTVNLIPLGA